MKKSIIIFGSFVFSVLLLASTYPKIYSGLGTLLYQTEKPTRHLAKSRMFKQEKKQLLTYVETLNKTKKLGFWCDKHTKDPHYKNNKKKYIKALRSLEKENAKIEKLLRQKIDFTITKGWIKSYYYLKQSQHPLFKKDTNLKKRMERFENRLKREERQRKEQRKRANKKKKEAKENYLKSPKNLNGKWVMKTGEETRVLMIKNHNFTLMHRTPQAIFELQGRWNIDKNIMSFTITTIIQTRIGKPSHARHAKVLRKFKIEKISSKQLHIRENRNTVYTFKKVK